MEVLSSQPDGWVTLGLGKALERKLLRCSSETQAENNNSENMESMYRTRALYLYKISDVLLLL